MDAATPRDLDQLDAEALKALVLALREHDALHLISTATIAIGMHEECLQPGVKTLREA